MMASYFAVNRFADALDDGGHEGFEAWTRAGEPARWPVGESGQ